MHRIALESSQIEGIVIFENGDGSSRPTGGPLGGISRHARSLSSSASKTRERDEEREQFAFSVARSLPTLLPRFRRQGFFQLAQAKLALGPARVGHARYDLSETLPRFKVSVTTLSSPSLLLTDRHDATAAFTLHRHELRTMKNRQERFPFLSNRL